MDVKETVREQLRAARAVTRALGALDTSAKNRCLEAVAAGLERDAEEIFRANEKDVEAARASGLPAALVKRLEITEGKLAAMVRGVRTVAALPDPVGQTVSAWKRPNGLEISKVRVPLGVIALVYESRPDATTDVAALALKSGNAVVLRGGKEALGSNRALVNILREAYRTCHVPEDALQFIDTPDRSAVGVVLSSPDLVDVVIPRGGESLIRTVVEQSRVPVVFQTKGVCHAYVDVDADLEEAVAVVVNAKTSNPAVCNALECVLVHRDVAAAFLPVLGRALSEKSVEIRGCPETLRFLPGAKPAVNEDWGREFLDLILAVKVVAGVSEALDHIAQYGSGHSEAVLTRNLETARRFCREVDAACVYVNASTRFTDGGEFGFGAEVGISTQKLHARGPMGLEDLTSTKYVVVGEGHVRL